MSKISAALTGGPGWTGSVLEVSCPLPQDLPRLLLSPLVDEPRLIFSGRALYGLACGLPRRRTSRCVGADRDRERSHADTERSILLASAIANMKTKTPRLEGRSARRCGQRAVNSEVKKKTGCTGHPVLVKWRLCDAADHVVWSRVLVFV